MTCRGKVCVRSSASTPSSSGGAAVATVDNAPTVDELKAKERRIEKLKIRLLGAVASLDRGLAANAQEAKDVDGLATRLEQEGGAVTLSWAVTDPAGGRDSATLAQLSGTWRLVYSSGFNSGSLGGRRPGPPAAFSPFVLGQVYQKIDPQTVKLDNIVELLFSYGFSLPFNVGGSGKLPDSPAARLTLRHDYEVEGVNTVRIVFEDTSAELVGSSLFSQVPKFNFPQLPDFLKPPRDFRSATFNVTYLDGSMRVTRGDRGELRIYLRDTPLEVLPGAKPITDYED